MYVYMYMRAKQAVQSRLIYVFGFTPCLAASQEQKKQQEQQNAKCIQIKTVPRARQKV